MSELPSLARALVLIGLGLTGIGLLVGLLARFGLPLGQLPGDLRLQSGSVTCLVPLASMLILSLVLTLVANLLLRVLNK